LQRTERDRRQRKQMRTFIIGGVAAIAMAAVSLGAARELIGK
jgi:hypothetical protein